MNRGSDSGCLPPNSRGWADFHKCTVWLPSGTYYTLSRGFYAEHHRLDDRYWISLSKDVMEDAGLSFGRSVRGLDVTLTPESELVVVGPGAYREAHAIRNGTIRRSTLIGDFREMLLVI